MEPMVMGKNLSMPDKFVKRYAGDLMMFTWVYCFRMNFPATAVENAIKNYAKYNELNELTLNVESEKVKYYRMEKEYREMKTQERKEGSNG